MALNNELILDATEKGAKSRFINHSCEPNAEMQKVCGGPKRGLEPRETFSLSPPHKKKWTVAGRTRIGFFATREIRSGDEITFDYNFERYG